MLQLVVGPILELAVVALGDEVEARLAFVVVGELLVVDLPADRMAVLQRRELVPEPRGAGPVAADDAELLGPVRAVETDAVARGLGEEASTKPAAAGSVAHASQSRPPQRTISPGLSSSSDV